MSYKIIILLALTFFLLMVSGCVTGEDEVDGTATEQLSSTDSDESMDSGDDQSSEGEESESAESSDGEDGDREDDSSEEGNESSEDSSEEGDESSDDYDYDSSEDREHEDGEFIITKDELIDLQDCAEETIDTDADLFDCLPEENGEALEVIEEAFYDMDTEEQIEMVECLVDAEENPVLQMICIPRDMWDVKGDLEDAMEKECYNKEYALIDCENEAELFKICTEKGCEKLYDDEKEPGKETLPPEDEYDIECYDEDIELMDCDSSEDVYKICVNGKCEKKDEIPVPDYTKCENSTGELVPCELSPEVLPVIEECLKGDSDFGVCGQPVE